MQIDLFMTHLREFFESHGISTDVEDRFDKCTEEDIELWIAFTIRNQDNNEALKEEAIDRLITALALLDSLGVKAPLFAAYQKLVETAKRPEYIAMRNNL